MALVGGKIQIRTIYHLPMVTKSSREMQKDREKIRPPFGGLKFCQGTHYLPLTIEMVDR